MPLPTKTNLETLDIAYLGQPFVQVEAKPLNTQSLDTAYFAQPFSAVSSSNNNLNIYINVAGTWKQGSAIYVNVAGTWKQASTVSTNIAGTWKT
jgi:hypothetical protein